MLLHVLFILSLNSQVLLEQHSKDIPIKQSLPILLLFVQRVKPLGPRDGSPAKAGDRKREYERKRVRKGMSSCFSKSQIGICKSHDVTMYSAHSSSRKPYIVNYINFRLEANYIKSKCHFFSRRIKNSYS